MISTLFRGLNFTITSTQHVMLTHGLPQWTLFEYVSIFPYSAHSTIDPFARLSSRIDSWHSVSIHNISSFRSNIAAVSFKEENIVCMVQSEFGSVLLH